MSKHNIDTTVFSLTAILLIAVCLPLIIAPEWGKELVLSAFKYVTADFGVVYIITGVATLVFLLWLAFSKYGAVPLSNDNTPPQYSNFSWAAMMFCAGIGSGILYWAPIEWSFYYAAPPYSVEPRSVAAMDWASSYGIFHWGIIGWALYCLPAVALSHTYHVKNIQFLRMSAACEPLLKRQSNLLPGRIIDVLAMVGLLGAAGTSLGFAVDMISAMMAEFLGIERSLVLDISVMMLCILIFGGSVYAGLEKGIKRLSNLNAVLVFIFVGFILVVGPTVFILKAGVNSIGFMLNNFIRMSFWTDPFTDSGFVESWTVFYWAWWIALGPFVGIFVTKISQGRTIRELIFAMLGYGSLGCALIFIVMGNYALYLEINDLVEVVSIVQTAGVATAITQIILNLPFGHGLLFILSVIAIIFAATTYDSASYTLASCASKNLSAAEHPVRWHRLFWACSLGLLPITLLYLGGLKTLQTMSIVVSLPLIAIFVLLAASLLKSLSENEAGA